LNGVQMNKKLIAAILGVIIVAIILARRNKRVKSSGEKVVKELPAPSSAAEIKIMADQLACTKDRTDNGLSFPFKAGTKQLAKGWKHGRGDQKGSIIHVATGAVWNG